ncbi:DUF7619 domain-containing protein [Flavobacterium terrigena]|uniref:Por secretion system C-terminal sorting domain-containing protein n=1 Tax=Flavobacterium terrigena TaxID=402734 RepID=A0A1H6WXD1_9FLAO|nr:T9SS type A sorting domain-containing protein [Flavobacterium terrigena]SEJ17440.1 Por secretion system C-terminal sorting domain-containing protein [Flavobacterium terrigena]
MKKIIYLLLLFSLFANAQLTINQPTDLSSCNSGNLGVFDLTSKNSEILGSLDPAQYSVSYYEDYDDCLNAVNSIQNPTNYVKGTPGYVQVRVFENQNLQNFGFTYLYLIPTLTSSNFIFKDLTVYETPNDNVAVFNLTSSFQANGLNITFSYFLTESDANNNVNPILNPTAYTNTSNPQYIYARPDVVYYNCASVERFKLYVETDGIINFTDQNLKAKLLAANESNSMASNVNPNSTATWNIYTKIDTNLDGEIQFSEANEIVHLNISGFSSSSNGGIQSLQGLEYFKNLVLLNCKYNQLNSISIGVFEKLENFYCSYNNMTSLNLSNASSLKILDCSYNMLTNLNTNDCAKLESVQARNNQLSSVNFNNNNNIEFLYLVYNNLTNFQISNKNFFRTLEIGFNQLTNLQLINLPLLYRIKAQNNNLTNVDLSSVAFQTEPNNLPNDNELDIALNNNLNLNVVNLKNGFYNSNISFFSANMNNTPQFICVEDNDVFSDFTATPNSVLNSYCSFNPGGNYNTIEGSITYDGNGNGCEVTDLPQPNIKIDITNGINQGSTFTNNSGNYKFYTDAGSFAITPNMENTNWFSISPASANIAFGTSNNTVTTQDFCISPVGTHPDLEIVVFPVVPARPGFDAVYKIVYKNKGNQTLSQAYGVNFFYNENVMDYVSASVVPTSINSGGLSWSYTNLLPFENRSILVTFSINTPTDTPPVNIGDGLQFTTSILPMAGDESTSDNTFLLNQTVVGAFDPNDISCLEGNVVSPSLIGEYLHYAINFENTGNYEAENIVVRVDVNAADFDVNSLRLLNTSHNSYVKVTGNVVEIIFENIALSSGGHGNILLKVKSKNNLVTGDLVVKNAKIYFDYNAPIQTNLESTVFQSLASGDFVLDNSIALFPNPTKDKINVSATSNIKNIHVYDVQGRLLETGFYNDVNATVDLSRYNHGVYLLKIITDKGANFQKVIRE